MKRRLEPEWLDGLDPEDPEARQSRKDLRRLNHFLGNFRWFEGTFRREVAHPMSAGHVLELGSGDGALIHLLAGTPETAPSAWSFAALDLSPAPPSWPESWSWICQSVLDPWPEPAPGVVLSNLFLHHFDDPDLGKIGRAIEGCGARVLLVNEPFRNTFFFLMAHLIPLLGGMGRVTRNDAPVSVRAGFRRGELASLLNLNPLQWMVHESIDIRGMVRLSAVRR